MLKIAMKAISSAIPNIISTGKSWKKPLLHAGENLGSSEMAWNICSMKAKNERHANKNQFKIARNEMAFGIGNLRK